MDRTSYLLEEHLREAAAAGDIRAIQELIIIGVDVNARHNINGWTALHWACKRSYADIVLLLLHNGANKTALSNNGESPTSVCTDTRILNILGVQPDAYKSYTPKEESTTFVPNYLKNPPLNYNSDLQKYKSDMSHFGLPTDNIQNDLVLKIRVADSEDPDFVEIDIPRTALTYNTLVQRCCEELNISENDVVKIRKLPNTKLRNDKDIQRLLDFQEIEVLVDAISSKQTLNGTAIAVTPTNNYQSISKKDQTILY